MRQNNVYLEDVVRAARLGLLISLVVSLGCLAALLVAGIAPALAVSGAAVLLAVGALSGGFGLVVRVALRTPGRGRRRSAPVAGRTVPPFRVPQPR